jgi:hypothetical protein
MWDMPAVFERTSLSRETVPPGFSQPNSIERFGEMLAMVLNDPSTPPPVRNSALAVVWFIQIDTFRALEDKFLISGEYEAQIDDHRVALSELLSAGERLVALIKSGGLLQTQFSLEDVEATVASLRTTFNCEHGPKNPPEINDLIFSLFDGAKR